ncbi:MAG: histidine--tRNA ligase [Desulfurococcaceae archaeon]|uniref:Histidine--tRNA ligase n=1 Tax=Staphylothermus marinus TaxID=2280 RepID=A0A7C4NNY1_STAMA
MSRFDTKPPRGVRDIVKKDAELYEYLIDTFKKTARLHGFKPIIPPTIEYYSLFEAKSGVEIRKSMYVFKDKAGRTIALRPEATASIVRIYLDKLRSEPKPIRLYYVTQCFRYEEPQKARYREFWQAGLEIIGEQGINADLSVAYTASSFLEEIGLKHNYIVNNIYILRTLLTKMGINQDIQDHILHLIDKNMINEALELIEKSSNGSARSIVEKLLGTSIEMLESFIDENRDVFGETYSKVRFEYERLLEFINYLREVGYEVRYEPKLVRGLAYYTGLIYEYKTEKLMQSIGGGGRYDGLTEIYGGVFEYSTGLALGLDRIALVMENSDITRSFPKGVVIISLQNTPLMYSYKLLKQIVEKGFEAWVYRTGNLGKAISLADRLGYGLVVIVGEREVKENKVSVKNLRSGVQETIALEKISEYLEKTMNSQN